MCQHNLPCSIVYAHCLLPGRAFASLYVLLFLEEAVIGGRELVLCIIAINKYRLGNLFILWGNISLFFDREWAFSGPSYGLAKSLGGN